MTFNKKIKSVQPQINSPVVEIQLSSFNTNARLFHATTCFNPRICRETL